MYYWPKASEHKSDRLPLKSPNEFEKYIASEEVRLEKDRLAKNKEEDKKKKEIEASIEAAKAQGD